MFDVVSLSLLSRLSVGELLTMGRMWLRKVHPSRLQGWVESEGQQPKDGAGKFPFLKVEKQLAFFKGVGGAFRSPINSPFLAQFTKVNRKNMCQKNRLLGFKSAASLELTPFAGFPERAIKGATKEIGSPGRPSI